MMSYVHFMGYWIPCFFCVFVFGFYEIDHFETRIRYFLLFVLLGAWVLFFSLILLNTQRPSSLAREGGIMWQDDLEYNENGDKVSRRPKGSSGTTCYTGMPRIDLFPENPTVQEAKEVSKPTWMRKRIDDYARYDVLTRRCFEIAAMNKCDGLDKMTILAFHALVENQKLKEQIMKVYDQAAPKPILLKDA